MARTTASSPTQDPPGAWRTVRRLARTALAPVERFLAIQAASGILLLIAAAVALVWANSPWRSSYEALWHVPFGLDLGAWSFRRDLHFRREIHHFYALNAGLPSARGWGPPMATDIAFAKLAILVASALAGTLAIVAGRLLLPAECSPQSAPTAAEAESWTEA